MSNQQRKISDILWEAANIYLAIPKDTSWYSAKTSSFSCNAINLAITDGRNEFDSRMKGEDLEFKKQIMEGLLNMGLKLGKRDYCSFFEGGFTTCGENAQMARYGWLMFAHEIALEQGV